MDDETKKSRSDSDQAPASDTSTASTGFFNGVLAAMEKGAASIYHRAVSVEQNIQKWTADHKDLQPLIDEGLKYANGLLGRLGVPGAVTIIGEDILASLKEFAAADSNVHARSQAAAAGAPQAAPNPGAQQPPPNLDATSRQPAPPQPAPIPPSRMPPAG